MHTIHKSTQKKNTSQINGPGKSVFVCECVVIDFNDDGDDDADVDNVVYKYTYTTTCSVCIRVRNAFANSCVTSAYVLFIHHIVPSHCKILAARLADHTEQTHY